MFKNIRIQTPVYKVEESKNVGAKVAAIIITGIVGAAAIIHLTNEVDKDLVETANHTKERVDGYFNKLSLIPETKVEETTEKKEEE